MGLCICENMQPSPTVEIWYIAQLQVWNIYVFAFVVVIFVGLTVQHKNCDNNFHLFSENWIASQLQ